MKRDADPRNIVTPTPWTALKAYTPARVALGRAGGSVPTNASLEFQLAHARARDAVKAELDLDRLEQGLNALDRETVRVRSAATDRETYIMRPNLGRRLDVRSRRALAETKREGGFDAVFVVADGLSATAVQAHATPLSAATLPQLSEWRLAPFTIVEGGRVAIGDEIGEVLQAKFAIVLIGERPGLSAPDSLGIYVTYTPKVGRTDAERNCISNVRPAGLSYEAAASELCNLLRRARRHRCTGVRLGGLEAKMLEG